jgi:hypothetical protein
VANTLQQQGEQFTRAALRQIGEHRPNVLATQDVLTAARGRIGAEFNRITANPLPLNAATSGDIATRLGNAFREYLQTVPDAAQRPFVERFMNDVLDAMTTPSGRLRANIPGTTVQHWRSRLTRMAEETGDPEFGAFLRAARNTLDDIYARGLPAGEAAAWAEARRQWAHLMTLEDAMGGAGSNTALGLTSPQQLRQAASSGRRERYAEGRVPYSDLAHAGAAVLEQLPNSGTPARLNVTSQSLPGMIFGGISGRTVGNPVIQAYLGNQALAGPLRAMGPTRPGMVARALALQSNPSLLGQ